MSFVRQFLVDLRVRANALFRRGALRDRLDEEMRFHLEMREERLMAAGVAPDEARRRARREFGNLAVLREAAGDMWRYGQMERLFQDLRYAARTLARTPAFTAVAVLSLALGIGANAAIFTLIDRVLVRMLPVRDPQQLVLVPDVQSYRMYEIYRERTADVFDGVFAFVSLSQVAVDARDDGGGLAEGKLVSGNYFDVLGIEPAMGRLLSPDDDRLPGAHPVVVISHAFWRQYFNGDPNVVGRSVRFGPGLVASGQGSSGFEAPAPSARAGGSFTIVGVAPEGFFGESAVQHPDFWAPLMMQEHFMPGRRWIERKSAFWLRVMARLRPGVTREQARAAVNVVYQQAIPDVFSYNTPDEQKNAAQRKIGLVAGDRGYSSAVRAQFSQPLTVLMVMVGVVLLIASANLANLLMARASTRRREIGVRMALGAGRARLVRQLFTESLVLAGLGGAAALLVAWWGSRTMFAMVAERSATMRLDLTPDARMLAFTAIVAMVTAIIFGVGPAFRGTRVDPNGALKDAGPVAGRPVWKTGRLLVAAQVALSVVLLVGTGLFTRTLTNMKDQDLGYTPDNVIVMKVDPITAGYRGDEIGHICQALLARVRALPGVQAATFSENGLFVGTDSGALIRIEGYTPASRNDRQVRFDQVGPGYFTSLGIPLLLGRDFTDADNAAAERVTVINEKMARFYFGDRNPIGRVVHYEAGEDRYALAIVGVARDARDHGLREDVQRRMYVSFMQPVDGLTGANYEVRSEVAPSVMAAQLREAVRQVAPNMQVISVKPLTRLIDAWILPERMTAKLSLLFGIVAVILAGVGLYGVLAYSVARRTNEIGIRIAIGARPRDVVLMVVRETLVFVAAGIAVGIPAAIALTRYVETLLFGLEPNDVLTLVLVVAVIAAIAFIAAVVPARRAATVDPLSALRYE